MFESPEKLGLGLLTGVIFGFLLQKGRAAKYEVIVGQFLLRDFTVAKIMATAVIVGAIGVYLIITLEAASLHIRPLLWGGVLTGAVCFGVGIVVLGYCPGTSVAACGEGRRDAMVGVAGMLTGALLYVVLFPMLQPIIEGLGNAGEVTLPQVTGTSPWLWVTGLTLAGSIAYWLFPHYFRLGDRSRRQMKGGAAVPGHRGRPI